MIELVSNARDQVARLPSAVVPLNIPQCRSVWASQGLTDQPKVVWFPRKIFPYSSQVEELFAVVEEGPVDAILFVEERQNAAKDNLRDVMGWLQAPIIDLSGRAGEFADVYFDVAKPETWALAAACILEFRARRAQLSPSMRDSFDPEVQLLAHAYVSGRSLKARHYPLVKDAVCYPGHRSASVSVPVAARLVAKGLLRQEFFDRVHECGECGSRRQTVREECPSCRSAHLSEVELIHHYHCASLLPEDRFRQGNRLACPKCSQQLRNYGKDYDRPGRASECQACGKVSSEPEVGFLCLDCGSRCDGEKAKVVDLHSYHLTEEAVRLLTNPAGRQKYPDLMSAIARSRAEGKDPNAIAELSYHAREAIVGRDGELHFQRLRRLFLENLGNRLAQSGECHAGDRSDYLLLFGYGEELAARLPRALDEAQAALSARIEPAFRIMAKSAARA